jgi:hypothetical protein
VLLYAKGPRTLTHLVDELAQPPTDPRRTLCNRLVIGGTVTESDRWPSCSQCARALRRLHRQLDTQAVPLRSAPRAWVVPADLRCPVCGERMGLGARRIAFPTQRVKAVRVTLQLICDNDGGHKEKP